MEEPLQILIDALYSLEMEWKDIMLVTAGLSHPMGQLDMADWVADNPMASLQEMVKMSVRLMRKYQMCDCEEIFRKGERCTWR